MSGLKIVEARKTFLQAGDELLDPSQEKDLFKIAQHLAAPNAVAGLADNGQAAEVLALITAQPQTAQKDILAAPNAVAGLAYNGQAVEVLALITAQPQAAQKDILAAPNAVWVLADNGQAAEVEKIKFGWANVETEQKTAARPVHGVAAKMGELHG
jgi:hypothetical protein